MRDDLRATGVLRVTALKLNRLLSPAELAVAIVNGLAMPVFRSDNLVVNIGLDTLAALLGGGRGNPTVGGSAVDEATVRDLAVVQMLVTAEVSPSAPVSGDSALEGVTEWDFHAEVGEGDSLLTVTYPSTGQVRFSGLIPQPEKDGVIFTEEGLFSNSGKLIARTTYTPHTKTSALALQFDHTITLAPAP